MVQFGNQQYLWALCVLVPLTVAYIAAIRHKRHTRKMLGNAALVQQLTNNYIPKRYGLKIMLLFITITCLVLAWANLRKPQNEKGSKGNGIDVMLVLDVSKSMLSQDVPPNRLEKAKTFLNQLTPEIEHNRIGLVVYAGEAYLQMPLTPDAVATNLFIDNASPDLAPVQGTNIGAALRLADGSLDDKEKKYKAIVLVTDGEDLDAGAKSAAESLAENGTILYTVGVGTEGGAPIMENSAYKKDANGKTVISKLDAPLLQELAGITGGKYYFLDNSSHVVNDIATQLNNMQTKPLNNNGGYMQYALYYPIFLSIAVVLLLLEIFIAEKKRNKVVMNPKKQQKPTKKANQLANA
ncbi:VWA domain-containing protein [Hydrotalea sp.]|uniref:vWA domain-containing protein n=1 Tax=Hydrotalea sp. TaxID=2881279 RepID=UPI002632E726|nr:VWA domain-containing protein [Hydrotalea sp.]